MVARNACNADGTAARIRHCSADLHRCVAWRFARHDGAIERRSEVVGILANEDAIVRLVGAILLEQRSAGG